MYITLYDVSGINMHMMHKAMSKENSHKHFEWVSLLFSFEY